MGGEGGKGLGARGCVLLLSLNTCILYVRMLIGTLKIYTSKYCTEKPIYYQIEALKRNQVKKLAAGLFSGNIELKQKPVNFPE